MAKNKPEKSKLPKQPRGRASGETGVPVEDTNRFADKFMTTFGVLATVVAIGGMGYFFMSDAPDKITAAIESKHVQASTEPIDYSYGEPDDETTDDDGEKTFNITVLPESGVTKDDVIDYITSLDSDAFDQLIEALSGPTTTPANDAELSTEVREIYVAISNGEITDADGLADRLEVLSEEDFKALVVAGMRAISPEDVQAVRDALGGSTDDRDIEQSFGELNESLANAYIEAEARYPGQIDGSKRLKLVEDINASKYLYYVAEDGDTLLDLSQSFDVPLGQLVEINGIEDADKIPAGMIILFPEDTEQPEI